MHVQSDNSRVTVMLFRCNVTFRDTFTDACVGVPETDDVVGGHH